MADLPGGGLAMARRKARLGRDRKLILLGVVVFLFCIPFFSVLVAKIRSIQFADQPPAAGQQANSSDSQSALANNPASPTRILLLGSDQRPDDGGYRTDVIILLTLDPVQGTAVAVSFPRDLWVKVPSLYEMKINSVFQLGGFDAMTGVFQANFGVTPDYYVLTNFAGFTQFIDIQNGVDVPVGVELTDRCDLPQAIDGSCTVEPGQHHMDGDTALWYVRSRATSSDYDRLRRAQEVLMALLKKLANFSTLTKLDQLKNALSDNVQTNMGFDKALSFLPLAANLLKSPDRIKRLAVTEDQATPMFSWNGEWILLPDDQAVQGLLRDAGVIP